MWAAKLGVELLVATSLERKPVSVRAQLLVVGSRCEKRLARVLTGSAATSIINRSPAPVLFAHCV